MKQVGSGQAIIYCTMMRTNQVMNEGHYPVLGLRAALSCRGSFSFAGGRGLGGRTGAVASRRSILVISVAPRSRTSLITVSGNPASRRFPPKSLE